MNCQSIHFSQDKSKERIGRAIRLIPMKTLNRLLGFALYLLGAKRKEVAALVGMPDESLKTFLSAIFRDGWEALRDRRHSQARPKKEIPALSSNISVSLQADGDDCVMDFGGSHTLRIPMVHKIKTRTILLSLMGPIELPTREVAHVLGISAARCLQLAAKLKENDVGEALVDKRFGQTHDYRMGPKEKAELVRQFAARAITGHSISSETLSDLVMQQTNTKVSPRSVRWHARKLGLMDIKDSLPQLVESLKKNS